MTTTVIGGAASEIGCVTGKGLTLLYVGIAPKRAPSSGGRASRQTLRDRLRYHYRGSAEGSTLRLTLGCLLGLELRRVGSRRRMTFSAAEARLSAWMAEHALVGWVEHPEPWVLEQQLQTEATQAALAKRREQNARTPGGRPLGECTKYLLTGLLRCGKCGGGMEARSRAHGPRGRRQAKRLVFYGCAAFHRRGKSVCANRQTVPKTDAHAAVLASVEATLLNPKVLTTAIDRLADELAGEPQGLTNAMEGDLAKVEAELERLTAAVARGGELESLVEAIRDREKRRRELRANLAALARPKPWTVDRAVIVEELTVRVNDWQALLAAQPAEANRLLRQVLVGKLTMTPSEDGYRFTGTGTVQPLVAGLVPHNLASPTGTAIMWYRPLEGRIVRAA